MSIRLCRNTLMRTKIVRKRIKILTLQGPKTLKILKFQGVSPLDQTKRSL